MHRPAIGALGLAGILCLSLAPARADDMTLRTFDVTVTENGQTIRGKADANLASSDAAAGIATFTLDRQVSGSSAAYRHGTAEVDARADAIHVVFTKDAATTPRSPGIASIVDDPGALAEGTATAAPDPTLRLTLKLVEPPDPRVHLYATDWTKDGHTYHEEWRELTNTVKGIDVSEFDGQVNWAAVKKGGISFAITRVSDGTHHPDPTFAHNWATMRQIGIVRGVYQFFRSTQDPVQQADLLCDKVGKFLPGDLPPFLDVEQQTKTSELGGVSAATFVANMKKWIARVKERTGRTPIVYTGSFFYDDLGHPDLGLDLWLAQYVKDPGVSKPRLPQGYSRWTFWQYSEKATMPGVPVPCDGSIFNGTLADLLAYAWGTSGTQPSSSDPVSAPTDPAADGLPTTPATPAAPTIKIDRTLKEGDTGVEVTALQLALGFAAKDADGIFGPKTLAAVEKFQGDHDLSQDGVVGPATLRALGVGVSIQGTLMQGMKNSQVKTLQLALGFSESEADGVFGPATHSAVVAYQKQHGLTPDGVAGKETLSKLGLR